MLTRDCCMLEPFSIVSTFSWLTSSCCLKLFFCFDHLSAGLCSTFAKIYLSAMTEADLKEYDIILNDHDNEWDMYNWCVDQQPLPEYLQNSVVMERIKHFTMHKGKDLKAQMPPLD